MTERASQRLPLTGAQTGVWYGQRLDPASPVYNVGQYIEIDGPLDPELLGRAVERTVAETEALTARFTEDANGEPLQITGTGTPGGIAVIDHTAEADPWASALAHMHADMNRAADPAAGPLFRFELHLVAPERTLWYQRAHHIALDAYSFSLVSRRAAEIYTALALGDEPAPSPFGSLASVIAEESAYRASERCAEDRAYWLDRLADRPEPEPLSGAAFPAAASFLRDRATLSPETTTGLLAIARAARASWADVVTAAFAAYLHRSTGSRDVLLSLPAMARLGSAALKVPAMVVNVLPLRVAVGPDSSLADLVTEVAVRVRELRRHQRYRAEDIRRDLGLVGREAGLLGPMVNVKAFDNSLDFAGAPGTVRNVAAGPVEDLTLGLHHDAASGTIRFEFDGNPQAYDTETLAARCAEFAHFLTHAAEAGPQAPVGRIELLPAELRDSVLRSGNATDHEVTGRNVVDAFAARAFALGELPAVIAGDTTLSYAELDARANRLARLLADRGVGPEGIAGLALPRSADLLVAMLAVLKAGGAYLPLDLDYPADRLEFMVEDARPVCTLTSLAAAATAPEVRGVETIVLDAPDTLTALADLPPTAPAVVIDGANPAYVIYTSGSTGRPKGVVVPHAALANFLDMQAAELALSAGDRLIAVTTISFDIAALEIHTPLICGATVVLADRDTVRDPAALAALVDTQRPAVMQATPSLWHALLEDGRPRTLGGVRVLVGGEALPAGLAERLARTARSVTNVYGPTEVTIWATSMTLDPEHTGTPDIGTPFWNTRAYILDSALRPAPAGRPGELYLAGAQLARGYLGRYALTSERFVADPYGEPGTRMYRTGDLARRRADGRIDFLGRADDQVKVRGFRIEPGEIESALSAHPAVGRAVVLVREDLPGSQQLVGYVVPPAAPDAPAPDAAVLRAAVAERLPEYMVPSAVVVLDAFPLTANGKINRRALPAPDLSGLTTAGGRAPRGAREEILTGIFADVLGLPGVGPEDDFFSLGGHSLLAARVIARVRTALRTECTIRDVFEARTVAALATRIGTGENSAPPARPVLTAAGGDRPELLPLSHAQQRLWFLHQLEGPSATYNIPFVARFSGALDTDALAAALGDVVARHETLRTVFTEVGGEPYQRVLGAGAAAVPLRVRETPASEFDRAAAEALGHLFDLSAEPPLRVTVLRDTVTDAYALVVLVHHIASDEWSMGPFLGGLEQAYTARRAGEEPALGDLPVQYADFAVWQRDLLGDPQDGDSLAARQADFWRTALAGLPEELSLPTDRPRPAVASSAGGMVHREVPAALAAGIRRLARESGASVFMVVHAAVAALLHRLGAGEDIPLGSPVAGRADSALDGLVGFFVNTVVLRADLSGDPSFTELLERVRATDLAALDHTDLPFDALVEAVNPERSPSRHPLFQTMVSHSTVTQDIRTLFGLPAEIDRVDPGVTKFDLDVTFSDTVHSDDLDLEVFYASDLFDRVSVERFAGRLLRLLEQAVADPQRPVSAIELQDAEERAQLTAWNDTDRPVPAGNVIDILAQQITATPDATAVVAGADTLTFAELDTRINRLTRLLIDRGVGPDKVVALAIPRSVDSIVATLAVLKAGGAYLPLDLDYPAERLEYMLQDAQPICTLTTGTTPPLPHTHVLNLDAIAHELAGLSAEPVEGASQPGDAAYVIYTSGSTGRPKGVVLHHEGLTNLYRDHERELYLPVAERLGRRVRALHTASFSFDSSWEQLLWLIAGHELHILDEYDRRDAEAVVSYVRAHRIDTLDVTPSYGRQLLDAGLLTGTWKPPLLLLGGEAIPPQLWEELRTVTGVDVVNYYGPTEFTVDALTARVTDCDTPVIGHPLDNSRAHILDTRLRPVPPGVPGELYLSGTQNARGYLGRHALTAERFVADPYGPPGTRMYRTGDLARRRTDGPIEYLGRTDDQIKIRGFRIELGEIETALTSHEGVTAAAVIVRDNQLHAYTTGTANPTHLRTTLTTELPDYMIPTTIMNLDTLPTNINGKLDRTQLPTPRTTASETAREPRGEGEFLLARVFAEVLGLDSVSADDDFFRLGGHSLLATRVVARVRAAGGACSVRDVFEARTVAALAARLAERTAADRPALTATPHRPEHLPLSHAQRRLWFLDQLDGASSTYNVPFAVRLRGTLDVPALRAALHDVVTRHETLRTLFAEQNGEPHQRILDPADIQVPFTVAEAPADTITERVAAAADDVFDLAVNLPLRVTLLKTAEDDHTLVLLLHHIATDEWSTGPLLTDLDHAYRARTAGNTPTYTDLPVQYTDFALWQHQLLGNPHDSDSLATRQANHWRTTLTNLPEELTLPTDRPRPATPSHNGDTVEVALPSEVVPLLDQLVRESGATMFMVVHAAVAALLHRLGAGEDIPLGSPVSGRGDEALDGLVGFFVNTVVLRADLSGDPSFTELLERVRATDLAALDHTDLPFDALVEAVNPERSPSRHPLFQTMVAYEGGGPDLSSLLGTSAEELPILAGAAKFDLDILFRRTHTTGMTCGVRYATDLFDRVSVERFAGRLLRLLEQAVADPQRPVSAIELQDAEERAQLTAWNDTDRPVPAGNVIDILAQQITATPDATAVVAGADTLTFAELDTRINRLTRLLIDRGVGPDKVVALAIPRSIDAVIATLAVLKAGGAYLPLDLDYPAERLEYMLQDAQPICTLTTGTTPPLPHTHVIVLDQEEGLAETSAEPLSLPGIRPGDAAYVIYTSGSTGRPKGVVLHHEGLSNLYRDHERELYLPVAERLGRRVRALHTASFSFDSSWEQLLWLIAGHELHILDEYDRRDAEAVVSYVRAHRIDTLDVTPSYGRQLLDAGLLTGTWKPPLLLLGGEAIPPQLWEELRTVTGVDVVNYYGPTEFTVDALTARVTDCDTPVIGHPLDNSRAHILDTRLRPVPPGVPGELYLSGTQNARGYLGRHALTAERFIADPYGPPGTRMYRTGDLARRRTDGPIEYLGRTDDQIKIRGFRVELGEIETALTTQPGVTAAAVIVRDNQLHAYTTGTANPTHLRTTLTTELPDYMIPTTIMNLDTLPTNINGKLDRTQLPTPRNEGAESARGPRDAREEIIAGVFAETLGLSSAGVDDDFFRLGGHSLLATRAVSRIRTALKVECGVRDVFEARTVAALAARLAERTAADRPALTATPHRPEHLPLSHAQRRLWLIDSVRGPGSTYNVPLAIRLRGTLDIAALRAALHDVVTRHETLRTLFAEHDGEPHQRILDPAGIQVPFLVRETTADRVTAEAIAASDRVFDLAVDLPLRVTLLKTAEDDHTLVLLLHHIATDEWSTGPLLADLDHAYRARSAGNTPAYTDLPVQYTDFALWQHQLLGNPHDSESLATRQANHWRTTLTNLPEELTLPTDRPRPATPSHNGDVVTFEVSDATAERLGRIARESGATMFMVVHAAVAALLHRLGAGEDIPLGSPVSGREDEALNDLVGFFLNTLVIRADLSGDPGFTELVGRVRDASLTAFSHADLPLEQVVEAVGPARSPSRNPLFQTMVTYYATDGGVRELFGLAAEEVPVEIGGAKVDLEVAFAAAERGGRISGGVRYATDLFDRVTAEELTARLLRLLDAVAADPGAPVSAIEVMSAAERELVLTGWNDTGHEAGGARTLADLVAAGAGEPSADALVSDGRALSRGEFDARVNRLARLLTGRGVGPESIVAVALPRSFDLLVAIHAVVRAGGAYLPLDLSLPADRLAYMTATANPVCVLTDRASLDALPPATAAGAVVLDDPATRTALEALSAAGITDADRTAPLLPRHPAYVIFTSGSTGRPKGVLVEHAAIVNRLQWMQGAYGLTGADRVLHKTPTGFDVSVWELFWPLAQGAPLVIARPDGHKEPEYLAALIREQHISVLHFVPSMLQAFLGEVELASCPGLRLVVCSGEALPGELVERFHASALPGAPPALENLYGPTEAAVDVTAVSCPPGRAGSASIGSPVWNTRVYVLDRALRPVPAGVPGELYLAGVQLARGYVTQQGLTAERFVADPYGGPGARMYRTGDVARWRTDGRLDYLGRADDQVKLRGFRIELGEIEAVLAAAPGIERAVVVVREDVPGVRRLVGYAVPAAGSGVDRDALRRLAAEQLPEYMVPSVILELDRVPLSPNGKLDRRALPAPAGVVAPGEPAAVPAAPPAGESPVGTLTRLMGEVLGRPSVGADDNFFELGGDSIVSIRLVSLARKAGLTVTARQIFQQPTPAGLAEVARSVRPDGAAARPADDGVGPLALPPIARWLAGRGGPFRRFSQARLVRLPAGVREAELAGALQAVLDRHDGLRQRLTVHAPGVWTAEVRPRGAVRAAEILTTVEAAEGGETALRELIAAESDRATGLLDPVAGRTVRAVRFDSGPGRPGRLLLVAHHLVVDEVSWQILLPDLRAAWEALAAGRAPELDPVATSLRAWTGHLLAEAHSERRVAELGRWRAAEAGTGSGALGARALDPARDTVATARELTVRLSAGRTAPLLDSVPAAFHGTVNDTLLTALALAIGAHTGDSAPVVELEGHGREQELLPGADLTRTVGWLTSLYPLRLDTGGCDPAAVLTGREDAAGALKAVKELVRAVPDGGIGAGLLRYANAGTARLFDAAARPEILWNYLGRNTAAADGADWGPAAEADALEVRPDPATPLSHPLEITAEIENGPDGPRLVAGFIWAGEVLSRETVGAIADGWRTALDALASWADGGTTTGGHTPSDLDLVDLDQDQISMLESMWRDQQ
ncbi:amino acid adenylation domain-containing protein [Streptomyces sp. CAU 1734]|uniref:amino acid adenylation domain-containing protein n=1 Tax=Streptomyces sp. CAU 1734 TaxID=3140360 RepID=UPI0032603F4B